MNEYQYDKLFSRPGQYAAGNHGDHVGVSLPQLERMRNKVSQ